MGFLTTITIRNDAIDTIKNNQDEFMEGLLRACAACGSTHKEYFGVGNHANPVVLQRPRHADDHTIYVHMGNTVVEMNVYSKDTQEMVKTSPTFFDDALKFLEKEIKKLKQLRITRNGERRLVG